MTAGHHPLVSVVLPTRNRSRVLGEAIGSVLSQSMSDLELIVVDDASTDDTTAVVAQYGDARVQYLRLEQPSGAPAARNAGIALAAGPFVAFQDSDDLWLPSKLERQMECFGPDFASPRSSIPDAVFTGMRRRSGDTDLGIVGIEARERPLLPSLLEGNFISTQTVVARTDVVRLAGGFDGGLRRLQDWDLWLSLLEQGAKIVGVPEVLVVQRMSNDSITLQAAAYLPSLERILDTHRSLFLGYPAVHARHRAVLARGALRERRAAESLRQLKAGLAGNPVVGALAYASLIAARARWRLRSPRPAG